jgi:hypothetical protein
VFTKIKQQYTKNFVELAMKLLFRSHSLHLFSRAAVKLKSVLLVSVHFLPDVDAARQGNAKAAT